MESNNSPRPKISKCFWVYERKLEANLVYVGCGAILLCKKKTCQKKTPRMQSWKMSRLSLRSLEVVYEQPFGLFFILFRGDWHPKTYRRFFQVAVFFFGGGKVKFEKKTIAHPLYRVKLWMFFGGWIFVKSHLVLLVRSEKSYGKIWQNHFIPVNLESFNLIFLGFLLNRSRSYHLRFNKRNIFSGHWNWDPSQIPWLFNCSLQWLGVFYLNPKGVAAWQVTNPFGSLDQSWTGPGSNPCFEWNFGSGSLSSNSPSKLDREMKHGATNPFPFRVAPNPREKHDCSTNLPSGKQT